MAKASPRWPSWNFIKEWMMSVRRRLRNSEKNWKWPRTSFRAVHHHDHNDIAHSSATFQAKCWAPWRKIWRVGCTRNCGRKQTQQYFEILPHDLRERRAFRCSDHSFLQVWFLTETFTGWTTSKTNVTCLCQVQKGSCKAIGLVIQFCWLESIRHDACQEAACRWFKINAQWVQEGSDENNELNDEAKTSI